MTPAGSTDKRIRKVVVQLLHVLTAILIGAFAGGIASAVVIVLSATGVLLADGAQTIAEGFFGLPYLGFVGFVYGVRGTISVSTLCSIGCGTLAIVPLRMGWRFLWGGIISLFFCWVWLAMDFSEDLKGYQPIWYAVLSQVVSTIVAGGVASFWSLRATSVRSGDRK